MNVLITKRPILQLGSQFSTQNHLFHSSSFSPENPNFLKFCPRKISYDSKTVAFCANTASDTLGYYGGWDHPQLGGRFEYAGEYNQLQSFLFSVGIGDRKYLFVYLLGFVCALAISRIKVSSIIVFPVCATVFAVGFSVGFFNGGHVNLVGAKNRPKSEHFKESIEKLGNLVDLLSGFAVNIENLKNGIKKGIDCNQISLNDLGNFLKTVESIDLATVNAKSIAEDCMGSIVAENQDMEINLNQKSSRGKKEGSENEFSFTQFFGNLFQGRSTSSKPTKMKDSSKKESSSVQANHGGQGNVLAPLVEERAPKSSLNKNAEDETFGSHARNRDNAKNLINGAQRVNAASDKEFLKFAEMDNAVKAVLNSNRYTYQKRILEYTSNQEVSWKGGHAREVERWDSQDNSLDAMDFRVSLKHQKTEAEFGREQKRENFEGDVKGYGSRENDKSEAYKSVVREDGMMPDSEASPFNHESTMASEDMEFSRYLVEANNLLKAAKECLLQQGDDEVAENYLYKSAGILLKAKSMRPMSLLAAGQLGNTYLLHGELKLRLSRELRALIARDNPAAFDELSAANDLMSRKDKISSILVNVCDECEELLVNAGRNYRLALSIDGNDTKAMYNWGLALFFRAQLIADIGPGAARDADKVYLAAIDKFDAMMSKSNSHAPDALFRWGAALQQRSRLRPRNSKEKVKLLQQARRLYEDALDFDSDNIRVQDALSSCVSELKYWFD